MVKKITEQRKLVTRRNDLYTCIVVVIFLVLLFSRQCESGIDWVAVIRVLVPYGQVQ